MTTILIVAAHPDDEVLGCGGTAANHAAMGDEVRTLIVGEGASSRDVGHANDVDMLKSAAIAAAHRLTVGEPKMLGLTDNRLDSYDLLDIVKLIEAEIRTTAPDVIYTHHAGDLNQDHKIVHQAVLIATRPQPGTSVKQLLAFETPSATEWQFATHASGFRPNVFVDISNQLHRKLDALRCYESEMRDFPHPRSEQAIVALAQFRGSHVSYEAAEAFELIWSRGLPIAPNDY